MEGFTIITQGNDSLSSSPKRDAAVYWMIHWEMGHPSVQEQLGTGFELAFILHNLEESSWPLY